MCGQDAPWDKMLRHKWDAHRPQMLALAEAARAKSRSAHPSNGRKPDKPEAPRQSFRQGGDVATIGTPAPAAVIFRLGSQTIEVDPGEFYETFLLCMDIKAKLQLSSSFSSILKDCVAHTWRYAMASLIQPQLDGKGVTVEVNHG